MSTSNTIRKWIIGLVAACKGEEKEVPIEQVVPGDVLVVKPGARIPVEGQVPEGFSAVDESMLTGESMPVDKAAGDAVYGPKNCITELGGQCLHAGLIGFKHPRTNEYIEIVSELPEYFTRFLNKNINRN